MVDHAAMMIIKRAIESRGGWLVILSALVISCSTSVAIDAAVDATADAAIDAAIDAAVPDARAIGAGCVDDTWCPDVCVKSMRDGLFLSGGICTTVCTLPPDLPDDCPDGSMCLRYLATGEQYCFARCSVDADCRNGWQCYTFDSERVCIPDF